MQEQLKKVKPSVGQVKFIAIDGHGGSGKSFTARYLAKKLHAQVIHTDDFASWENPVNWWPDVVQKVFEPIRQGAAALSYPRTKWWDNHHPVPAVDEPVTDIMILEGVGALRKEFRPYISFGVFVDTPIDICYARVVERDKSTGESAEKIEQLWNRWLKAEREYMETHEPKEAANVIIDGSRPLIGQLGRL